jgi:hypothetical protein
MTSDYKARYHTLTLAQIKKNKFAIIVKAAGFESMGNEYLQHFPEASEKAVEAVHRGDLYKARLIEQLKFVAANLVHYGVAINSAIRDEIERIAAAKGQGFPVPHLVQQPPPAAGPPTSPTAINIEIGKK